MYMYHYRNLLKKRASAQNCFNVWTFVFLIVLAENQAAMSNSHINLVYLNHISPLIGEMSMIFFFNYLKFNYIK